MLEKGMLQQTLHPCLWAPPCSGTHTALCTVPRRASYSESQRTGFTRNWGLQRYSLTGQKLLKIKISGPQIQLKSQTNQPNHLPWD